MEHDEGFEACLERSVEHAVRYLDGSSEWTEIAPGVNCKDVEDATRDLLDQMRALEVAESPSCGHPTESNTSTPLGTVPETAGIENVPDSMIESDEVPVDNSSLSEGDSSPAFPEQLGDEQGGLSRESRDDGGHGSEVTGPPGYCERCDASLAQASSEPTQEDLTQAESPPSEEPMSPWVFSSLGQAGSDTIPIAVPAYPVCFPGAYPFPVHVFYPMIPVFSAPSRQQDPRATLPPFTRMCGYAGQPAPPIPHTSGGGFCAVPKFVLGVTEGSMYSSQQQQPQQHPGWCQGPSFVQGNFSGIPGGSAPWHGYPGAGPGDAPVDQPETGPFTAVDHTVKRHGGSSGRSRGRGS